VDPPWKSVVHEAADDKQERGPWSQSTRGNRPRIGKRHTTCSAGWCGATTSGLRWAAADLLLEQSASDPGADRCDVLRAELHAGPSAQPDDVVGPGFGDFHRGGFRRQVEPGV